MKIKQKKGMGFMIDAVLAATLVILAIILIRAYPQAQTSLGRIDYTSQDIVKVLGNLRVHEYNHTYVASLINQSEITRLNNSFLEQIGEFWAEGKTNEARNLSKILIGDLVPDGKSVGIYINDKTIYQRNLSEKIKLWRQGRIISGIAKDKPVHGIMSRAFLEVKPTKRTTFAYFGGYVGDGNITTIIPLEQGLINVTNLRVEFDIENNFTLYINNNFIDTYYTNATPKTAERWNINGTGTGYFSEGNNTIQINFLSSYNSYIGGGYVRVDYDTSASFPQPDVYGEQITKKHYLTGIQGVINLYDAFTIPGNLTALEAYLHYANEFYTKLVIGNTTVYFNNETRNEVYLDNQNLSSQLDYSLLSEKTIPLRLRSQLDKEGDGKGADVVVITDLSGSMNWRIGYSDSTYGSIRSCEDSQLYDPDTKRISLAKCLDKEFSEIILNYSTASSTRNRIALVAYTSASPDGLVSFENLTNNLSSISGLIDAYPNTPSGGTCIACAIKKARELITEPFPYIQKQEIWQYLVNTSIENYPENDSRNNTWHDVGYNDSLWSSGQTIIGYPGVNTNIDTSDHINLWELAGDLPQPVDFTSGLNQTADTFGLSQPNDGWDSQGATYGFSSITLNDVNGERLEMFSPGSYSSDYSGAYGISINITNEQYTAISSGNSLIFTFEYEWDGNNPRFESSDQVWIKSRIHLPNGSIIYLGSDLDTGDDHSDATPEIATSDNPDNEFSGTYTSDISSFISESGIYYLDFGGKLDNSYSNEWGYFYFDNIDLTLQGVVEEVFFRKEFSVFNSGSISEAHLFVRSDDYAEIYLNGNLIDNDTSEHTGSYWNREISFNPDFFVTGQNIISAKVHNDDALSLEFDLALTVNDTSRVRHILTMTDGIPGYSYSPLTYVCGGNSGDCNTGACDDARDSTIAQSCTTHTDTNATIHAIGFGDLLNCEVANETLSGVAACGEGNYSSSSNATELLSLYEQLALNIISQTFSGQTSFLTGVTNYSILYPDSYILINYTSTAPPITYGTTQVILETNVFGNNATTGSLNLPSQLTVTDAQIISYSGSSWTDNVTMQNSAYPSWTPLFELSRYGTTYTDIGDPYHVRVPSQYFVSGETNNFQILTGLSPTEPTNGSVDDKIIYTARFDSFVNYTQVTSIAEGCLWQVTFEDNSTTTIAIPSDYSGANSCTFSPSSFDSTDALQSAGFALLSIIDFDNDGKLFFNPGDVNLVLDQISFSDVPTLWGPSIVEVRVWE